MLDNPENSQGSGPKDGADAEIRPLASAFLGEFERFPFNEHAAANSQLADSEYIARTSNQETSDQNVISDTMGDFNSETSFRSQFQEELLKPNKELDESPLEDTRHKSTEKDQPYSAEISTIDRAGRESNEGHAIAVSRTEKGSAFQSIHSAFRNISSAIVNRFNLTVIKCSESFFAAHPTGRLACVGCVVLGSAFPPIVYTQNIFMGLFVTAGALSAAIGASAVNRSLSYQPALEKEEIVQKYTQKQDLAHYRESLLITGVVAGPAAFWAAFSPLLSELRGYLISQLDKVTSLPAMVAQGADYASGRVEHLIPFLLIGALTTMTIVSEKPKHFIDTMGPLAGKLSPLFGWWGEFRSWVGKEFQDEIPDPSRSLMPVPEKISFAHSVFRNICHGFNHAAVWCSETIFTGNTIGRIACVGLTGFGWAIPPSVYSQFTLNSTLINPQIDSLIGSALGPCLGILVASAALSGAIAASAVNRALHYNSLLIGEDGIAWSVEKFGQKRFRESLSIAGLVIGPASFWAAISPLLNQLGQFTISQLENAQSFSPSMIQAVGYVGGRLEHLIPFVLIGAITTMRIVNQNPERFVRSMSPTAGMIGAIVANPIFSFRAGLARAWERTLGFSKSR